MRIIGGKLKGKSIEYLKSAITRPLKDSVRENIFNILAHSNLLKINLQHSNILDLYSGIGSFGLECMSRGANEITFVEKDKIAAKILNKNIINLALEEKSTVVEDEIINYLNKIDLKEFEIIFLDPPFTNVNYLNDLKLIHLKKIYSRDHVVIIHRERKTFDNLETIIKPLIIKEYGRSKIIFGKFLT
jgi:16S rRNA (guanine966-N2)-methyltransferase|tara:strand:- start:78 stop:641 length:564 start_codon:yes stop_codon:yes gene_type:complete